MFCVGSGREAYNGHVTPEASLVNGIARIGNLDAVGKRSAHRVEGRILS